MPEAPVHLEKSGVSSSPLHNFCMPLFRYA